MATSLTLENDSSLAQGYLKVNGSTAATLTTFGIIGNLTGNVTGNVTGSLTSGGSLTLATAQTASGTSVDFTGIPSWVKRITVMFNEVSTNGTSPIRIQIGGSSIESSGYNGCSVRTSSGGSVGCTSFSNGFDFFNAGSAPLNYFGNCVLSLITNNIWSITGTLAYPTAVAEFNGIAGTKQTASSLSIVRITTVNGTDTFDAGTINISYEG